MHFQYLWKKYLNFQTQCEKTRASVPHGFEKNFAPCNIKCYCNTQAKSNRFDSKAEFSVISVWAIVCNKMEYKDNIGRMFTHFKKDYNQNNRKHG